MALITWSQNFSVGVKDIDEQHKKLITLVNELHDAMSVGKGREVLGKILSDLISYTVYHFKHEEDLFEKYAYLGYIAHKTEHDKLAGQAGDIKKKFDSGEAVLTIEVMNFLRDWLNNHILGSDKKYGPFLNSKGVS